MATMSSFTISASAITIDGGSVDISITCTNNAYSHKLRHDFGTIATLAAGTTSYTWTPIAAQLTKFWEELPKTRWRNINVMLDTYNGSTLVGTTTRTLQIVLSEATGKPVHNGYTINDSGSAVAKEMGIWVYGKSASPIVKLDVDFKYGSVYSEDSWHPGPPFNNAPSYSSPAEALNWAAGLSKDPIQVSIESIVKDSRGFWSDVVTNKYYVANYKAPHIDTFEVLRCNASGVEDDNGTKAKVTIKGSWSAMKVGTVYKNAATLKVGYRVEGGSDAYTFQSISVSGGTVDVSQLLTAALAANTDYEFSVIFSDSFLESDTRSEVGFNNVGNIIYVSPDGKHVVIGSDNGNNVSIYEDSLDIRDKSTALATFTKNNIKLGTDTATINMPYLSIYSASSGGTQLTAPSGFHVEASPANSRKSATIDTSGYKAQYGFSDSDAFIRLMANVVQGAGSVPRSAIITASAKYHGNSQINLEADNININSMPITDFVIMQGTSGGWYYRKWASGKAEAMMWMKHRLTSWAWWNENSYIKYGMPIIPDVALPFKFVTIYCTMRTASNRIDDVNDTFVVGGHLNSDHTKWVEGWICSPNGDINSIVDTDIQFYISGTWK